MVLQLKLSQSSKWIVRVALLCVSILLTVHMMNTSHIFSRNARQHERKAQIAVTRSKTDSRSDLWLSTLQALSKARHLQTTILDTPSCSTSIVEKERDAHLDHLAQNIEWKQTPHIGKTNVNSSAEAVVETLGTNIDVFMTTSCAADLLERPRFYNQLLERTAVVLYCTVDDAEPFVSTNSVLSIALQPWADELRLQFIALSDDVARILNHEWAAKAPLITARTFPPIFNISGMAFPCDGTKTNCNNTSIAIIQEQEAIATLSRSTKLNKAIRRFAAARDMAKEEKRRLGNALVVGESEMLDTIQTPMGLSSKNIEKVTSLNIMDTVKAIASAVTVVVGTSDVQTEKITRGRASSVLPLAIVAGIPPVVDEETLASHAYLDHDATIVISSDDAKQLRAKITAGNNIESVDMIKAFEYPAIPFF